MDGWDWTGLDWTVIPEQTAYKSHRRAVLKNGKKGDIVPFGRPPPLNGSRDILMSKARKMTILTITMFYENVHTGCLF